MKKKKKNSEKEAKFSSVIRIYLKITLQCNAAYRLSNALKKEYYKAKLQLVFRAKLQLHEKCRCGM